LLAYVCTIADGVDEGRYLEPEIEADYYEQVPEVPNAEPALPEDFEDGKFNLTL
jgi:glutamine synthetase